MAKRPALGKGWTLWPHALVRGAGFPFSLLDEVLRADDVPAALRRVAQAPKFREAVLWQNRGAVADGLDSLLRQPEGATDARTRKKELLVARYLQRYAAKNDTIGFFGPVGWVTVGGAGRFDAGPGLLEARQTFFEPWAVRALAEACVASDVAGASEEAASASGAAVVSSSSPHGAVGSRSVAVEVTSTPQRARAAAVEASEAVLSSEEGQVDSASGAAPALQTPRFPLSDPRALRWWAPVSLPGDLRVTGRRLVTPTATHALSADEARVLLACDGVTPAKHLLHRLARTKAARATLRDVLLRLDGLGVLRWGFPVSLSLDPEAPFRAALARIRDMEARAQLAAPLEALCAARDAVAQAAGDATRLEPALAALESTFTAHTQRAATRHEGRTYGGRGLVFEEARRAVSLELSDAALTVIAPPLRVLLQVGRWYSFEVAQHLAKGLLRVFRRLGGRRVPLHVFWRATESLFDREVPPSVAHASKKLATRWAALWRDAEVRPDGVFLSAERAEALAQQRFAAPCPGWPGARHHAPDLMWSAPSAEAVLRGEGLPVLAELHPGVTPLSTLSVLSLCPVRTALETEWRRDFPPGLASPIPWEDFARSSQDARLAASHWHLDVGGDFASPRPARQTLRAADFDVVLRQGRLWAKHRSGGPTLDLLVVFERRIKLRAATAFSLGDGAPTGPRRLLGPLVVQRARWRFPAEALQSLQPTEGRAAAVLAWRAAHGIPERVFVRSPREVKPVYLDLLAPTSVEQLVRLARQAEWLAFSEMLPGPDGLWLRDDAGHTFVSEVRCVAVDPAPWDGALVWPSAPGR